MCESNGKFCDSTKLCEMHDKAWEVDVRKSSILNDVNRLIKLEGEEATKQFINSLV